MPANLTPEYERAERRYRAAATDDDRLDALREMLSAIPKHKGTEKMQADLKRRISQLRKSAARRGPARGADPFHVAKGGAGQVVLAGAPNSGKSMLASVATNAPVKVADYPYATALPVPGMAQYEDVQFQLVDTPPLTGEHVPPGLMGTLRAADVVCIVADAAADPLEQVEMVLGHLSEREVSLRTVPRSELDASDARAACGLIAANKIDVAPPGAVDTLRTLYAAALEVCPVSAATGEGLGALLKRLWDLLAVVRVYTKQPGRPPDRDRPFTLPIGSTVADLAREIHRELPEKMKYARIWGDGRYGGQHVHRTEVLRDRDVVEVHE